MHTVKIQRDLKLSRYLEKVQFLDQKEGKHKTLVYSTRTLKLLCVDSQLFSAIEAGEWIHLGNALLEKLCEAQVLVPAQEDELESVLQENRNASHSQDSIYLVFQTSAACQLGCAYCGQSHKKLQYSDETLAAIPEFVKKKFLVENHKYKSIYVCWFGAEPLTGLGSLRKLSQTLQNLASQENLSYASKMVTNGLLLTKGLAEDLVNNHKVDFFEVTLDGDKKSHDLRRHTKEGQATFDRIFKNIVGVASLPNTFTLSIRANVDERNYENVKALLRRFKEHELQERIRFYMAPIHSWGNDAHELAAEQKTFGEWELDTFVEMQEMGFSVNLLPSRMKVTCLAVNESGLLIDPSGDLYNCTEVSLVPSYEKTGENIHSLGPVTKGEINEQRKSIFAKFFDDLSDKKYPCSKCPILPVCGGRCPKEWNEGRIPCPPMKFNMQGRMLLSYLRNTQKEQEEADACA